MVDSIAYIESQNLLFLLKTKQSVARYVFVEQQKKRWFNGDQPPVIHFSLLDHFLLLALKDDDFFRALIFIGGGWCH